MNNKNLNHNSSFRDLRSSSLGQWGSLVIGSSILLSACSGGGDELLDGASAGSNHELVQVSNGFGQLLPHRVYDRSTLNGPGGAVTIDIRTQDDLIDNVRLDNPVHSVASYPSQAVLPNGQPGNHFLVAEFTGPLLLESILSDSPSQLSSNSFTGAIIVKAVDSVAGTSTVIPGQAFINRQTYGSTPTGVPARLPLETWFSANGTPLGFDLNNDGSVVFPDEYPGVGFPGTTSPFAGSAQLHAANKLVFVADSDGDLSTPETFPTGVQVIMEIQVSTLDSQGRQLNAPAHASSTVGLDSLAPEVRSTPPPVVKPLMTPAFMEQDVDPLTSLSVEFSEPIQPTSVGDLLWKPVPGLSTSISVTFGPEASVVDVPFHVRPKSVFDLTRWELIPAFNFPGVGPESAECGVFSRVNVIFRSDSLQDLTGNLNSLPLTSYFDTGEGPGLVNLPVTPDAVYIGRTGGNPGISVIDLHGFGAGTGNPTYDVLNPIVKGNSNYPNNPNVAINGPLLRPPLLPGDCTVNGGSAGVFTLSLDSSLNDKVVRAPILQSIGDMMLGQALDTTFNNGPAPYGCQAAGGNICAADGFKQIVTFLVGNSVTPADVNAGGTGVLVVEGGQNIAAWAPHPNPPPLIYPPLCVSPFIGGQQPTSVDSPAFGQTNLLLPGDNSLGNPALGIPPGNLLSRLDNLYFEGPSPPQQQLNQCNRFGLRQQIGNFLYVVDRNRNEILVLNSNRMSVIDRILIPDPTSLAFATNLDLLAVSSQSSDAVVFIDVSPESATFHEVVKSVSVGNSPRGIAWEAGNEDILVCNEGDDSVSIISAFSLEVRRVLTSGLVKPFEIALTPRQVGFSLARNVYFGYVLGRNGRVSVFESGPNGVNGWGFDDITGQIQITFLNPKTIHVDPSDVKSAFWVCHEGQLDVGTTNVIGPATDGAVTKIYVASGSIGQISLVAGQQTPQIRDINYQIQLSIGQNELTGVPVELAFDNQINAAALPNYFTPFSAGTNITLNGKAIVRSATGGVSGAIGSNQPSYMFCAIPNSTFGVGGVDVIDLASSYRRYDTDPFLPGIQSIPAPGATMLMDYFRQ